MEDYFERLHAEEARRMSWRMLDEALRTRQGESSLRRLRHGLGHALIMVGARLAEQPARIVATAGSNEPCR